MDKFADMKISIDKVKSQVVAESIRQGLIDTNDKYPTTQNVQRWFQDYFEPEVHLTDIGSVLKKFSSGEMEDLHNGLDRALKSNSNSSFTEEESKIDRTPHLYVNDRIGIVHNSTQVESSCKTNPSSLLYSSRMNLKHKLDDIITDYFTHRKHTEIEREDKSLKVPPLYLKHKLDDSITGYIIKSNHNKNECDGTHLNTIPLVPISAVCDIKIGENKDGNHAEVLLNKDRKAQLAFNKDRNHAQLALYNSNKEIPGQNQKGNMAELRVVELQTGNGNQLNTESGSWRPKQCNSSDTKKTSHPSDTNLNVNCRDISFPGITGNKVMEKEIHNEIVDEMEAIMLKVCNVNIQSTDIVGDIANLNHSSSVKGGANTDVNKKYYLQRNDSIHLEYSDSDLVIDETAMEETHSSAAVSDIMKNVDIVDNTVESRENRALDGNCKITEVNNLKTKVDKVIEVSANSDSHKKQSSFKNKPRVIVNTDDLETLFKEQDQDKLVIHQEYNTKSPIYDLKSEKGDDFAPAIFSTVTMTKSDFDRISHVDTMEISKLEVKKVDPCSVFDFTEEDNFSNECQNISNIDILKDYNKKIGNTKKHEQKVGLESIYDATVVITKDRKKSRKKRLKSITKKHKNLGLENKTYKKSPKSKHSLFGARLVIKQDKIVVQNQPSKYIVNADENDNTELPKGDNVTGNGDKISNGKNVTGNYNHVTFNSNNVNGNNVSDKANNAYDKGAIGEGHNVDVNGKKVTYQRSTTTDNNKGKNADKAASANSKSINRSKPLKKRKLTTQVMDMLNEKETVGTSPAIKKYKHSNPLENPTDESPELNTLDRLVKEFADHKLRRHKLRRVHNVNQGRKKACLKPGRNVYKKLKLRHRVGDKKYVEQSELPPEKKPEESNDCKVSDATTGSDIQKENREILPVISPSYKSKAIGQNLQGTDKTTPNAATVMPTLIPVTLIPCIPQKPPAPLVMNHISFQNHSLQLQPTLNFQPMTAIPLYHRNQISSLALNSLPYQANASKALANVQIPLKPQQQLIRAAIPEANVNALPTNDSISHPHMIMEQGNMNRTLLTSNTSQSIVNVVGQPISYITTNTQVVPLTPTYNTVTPNPYRCIAPAPNVLAIEPVYHAQPIKPSMPRNPISAIQSNHTGKNSNKSSKPMASITPMSSTVVGHSQASPLKGHSSQQIAPNKTPVSLTENDRLQIVVSSPQIEHKKCPNLSNPNAVSSTDGVQFNPQIVSSDGQVRPINESNTVAVQSNKNTSPAVPSKESTRLQIGTIPLATANVTTQEQSAEAPSSNVSQVNLHDTSSVANDKTNSFSHLLNIDEDELNNLKKLVKEYKKLEIMCLKLQELEELKKKELKIVTRKKQSTIRKLYDIKKTLQTVTLKDSVRDKSVVTPSINQSPRPEDDLALHFKISEEKIRYNLTSKISSSTKQDIEKQNEIEVKENAGILNNGNLVSGTSVHCGQGSNISDQESLVFPTKIIKNSEQSNNMKENQYEQIIPQNIIAINTDKDNINTHHLVDNIVNQLLQKIVDTVSATSNDKEIINLGTKDDIEDTIKNISTENKQNPNQSSTKILEEGCNTEKLIQSTLSAAIGSPSDTSHRGKKRGRPRKNVYGHKFLKNAQDQKKEYQNNLQITQMSDSLLPTELSRNPNEIKQVESAKKIPAITHEESIAQSNQQLPSENYSLHQRPPQDQGRNQAYANLQYGVPDTPLAHQIPPLDTVPSQPNISQNIHRGPPTIHQNNTKFLTEQAKYWQHVGFQRGLSYHNPQQPLHRQPPPNQYTPYRYDCQPPRDQQVHTQGGPPGYNYPYGINPRFPQERSYPQFVQQLPHQPSLAPRGPPPPVNADHNVMNHSEDAPNEPEMYRPTNYQHPEQKTQPSPPKRVVIEPQNQAIQNRVFHNQGHVMPSTHPNTSQDVHCQQRQFTPEYRPQELQGKSQLKGEYRVSQDQHVQHGRQMPNHQQQNLYGEAQPKIHKEPQSPHFTVVNNHINNAGINREIPLHFPETSNHELMNGQHSIQVFQNKPKEPMTYSDNPTGSIEVKQQIIPSGPIAAIIKANSPVDKERIMMQSNAQYQNADIQNISNNLTRDVTNKKPPPYQEVINSRATSINKPSITIWYDDDEQVDANMAAAGTCDKENIGLHKCSHCDKEASFVCSGCKKTTYCSIQCQVMGFVITLSLTSLYIDFAN